MLLLFEVTFVFGLVGGLLAAGLVAGSILVLEVDLSNFGFELNGDTTSRLIGAVLLVLLFSGLVLDSVRLLLLVVGVLLCLLDFPFG